MSRNSRLFERLRNVALNSRFAELVFAGGLPIIGYVAACERFGALANIWVMVLSTAACGWHILVVNDLCFPGAVVSRWNVAAAIVLPISGIWLACSLGNRMAVALLALMIVNWNLYSALFKKQWSLILICNFFGGFLHYAVGMQFAVGDVYRCDRQAVFFGLLMMGASMHHDAIDVEEDRVAGYASGAVRWGRSLWWRLGLIPIACGTGMLLLEKSVFTTAFVGAFVAYFVAYRITARTDFSDASLATFRFVSRILYGVAGMIFLGVRVWQLYRQSAS